MIHDAILSATGSEEPSKAPECRFNDRMVISLSEVGPGPAAGGPSYFRLDVWSEAPTLLGQSQQELFGKAYVQIGNPDWQRKPCTWAVVDQQSQDAAWVTCEYAFAHPPVAVRDLQVDNASRSDVMLSWRPPRMDTRVPVLSYVVEAAEVPRDLKGALTKESYRQLQWSSFSVGSEECFARVERLEGNRRHIFRVRPVNEAGPGDAVEVEATTAPVEPEVCFNLRLAGIDGDVVTIEWDPPREDNGAAVIAYWVRLRAVDQFDDFSRIGPPDWHVIGRVPHAEVGQQQCTLHCNECMNANVEWYNCSIAAENDVGTGKWSPEGWLKVPNAAGNFPPDQPPPEPLVDWQGMPPPPHWDLNHLRPPNQKVFQGQDSVDGILSEGHMQSKGAVDAYTGDWDSRIAMMPPLFQAGPRSNSEHSPWQTQMPVITDHASVGMEALDFLHRDAVANGRFETVPPEDLDMFERDLAARQAVSTAFSEAKATQAKRASQDEASPREGMQQLQQRLLETQTKLEECSERCHQAAALLQQRPDDLLLKQEHERAFVDVSALQAEVDVLHLMLTQPESTLDNF
jgi:hypothetical protein